MTKVRRGGYVFVTWKGDHGPRHVHVFRDGKAVARWDLEHGRSMDRVTPRRIRDLIDALRREGLL